MKYKRFTRTLPLFITFLFTFCACAHAERLDYDLANPHPPEYETVATARLDMVFSDGVSLLYGYTGLDKLTTRDIYTVLYKDKVLCRIQFSEFWGKMLKARIFTTGVHPMPEGAMVEIARESYTKTAAFHINTPWRAEHKFESINEETPKPTEPFGIAAQIDLIVSSKEIQIYTGTYTALLEGDTVLICSGLWKCVQARVRRATDVYVYLDVTMGDATVFQPRELVVLRDGPLLTELIYPEPGNQAGLPPLSDPAPQLMKSRRAVKYVTGD